MLQKSKFEGKKFYENNLRKIILETVLTSIGAGFSVPIMTVFWNSIGMDQTTIGFVQMMFTVIICILDIPMGYIADRFSRKALNIIGDIGTSLSFVLYALSQNVYIALLSEILLGVFMAMTNGVDQSFIKYNCDKIDKDGILFKKINTKIHTARYISLFVVTLIGGFIAKYSLRLCIGISFIPYFLGGLIAFGIKDFNEKINARHKNPFKDMILNVKEILKNNQTRSAIFAYIVGKEITHAQIWVFTPLLTLVGVPIEIVSIGWILNYIMQIIGSKISEKMVNLNLPKKFIIPVIIEFSWILILIFKVNIVTVWLFALNGFVAGMASGNLVTSVQESVKPEIQTSAMSVASTFSRMLYIPLVYIINYLGNISLNLALVGVFAIFLPLSIMCYMNITKVSKSQK